MFSLLCCSFPDAIQDTPLARDLFPDEFEPALAPKPVRRRKVTDDNDDDVDDVKPKSSRKKRSGEVKQFAYSNGFLLSLLSTMLVLLDEAGLLLSGEALDHESGLPRSLHDVAVHWAPVDANNSTPCLGCDVQNVTFRVSRSVTKTVPKLVPKSVPESVPESVPVRNLLFSHSLSSSRATVCQALSDI